MTTVRPITRLRLDAPSMGVIPRPWTWEASKIVAGGEVVKNRTGFGTADIGKPLGGPGSETALVTQEMVDYEEPGDWTRISVEPVRGNLMLTVTRDDADCGRKWIDYLITRLPRDATSVPLVALPSGLPAAELRGSKGKT